MNSVHGTGMAILLLVLVCIQGACAGFTVSYALADPAGNLTDGTPVTVTCGIPRAGILLYDQLVIATDLASPSWDAAVSARGQETAVKPVAATPDSITINGAVFNYPSPVQATLRVTVKGTVPYNHTTGQRLLAIRQFGADGFEYAYPTGYTLPMPGAPSGDLTETTVQPVTPVIIPVYTVTVAETPAQGPVETPAAGGIPSTKKPVYIRTPLQAGTTAAASPGTGLPAAIAAAGIALYLVRKKFGR